MSSNYNFTENGVVYSFDDVFIPKFKLESNLWVWGSYSGFFEPSEIDGIKSNNWKQVDSGGYHTAAIKTDGTLWTWATGTSGRLGTNDTNQRNTPVTTFAGGTNWRQVSSGNAHTSAIKTDGTLWTWGNGGNGRLGTNNTIDRSTPVTTFAGGTNWKQVSSGGSHTAAIKTDGTLWTWGYDGRGNLGDNNTTDRSTPVTTFVGGTNWKQVSSGYRHTAAIKTDGTLWTWGINGDGQLGTNDTNQRNTPVTTFAGGTNWKQVSSGNRHTAAVKTDGTLWTWGKGLFLGINQNSHRFTPVTTFAGGTNWNQVSSCSAVKTDGTLWTWGTNVYGQLGINNLNISTADHGISIVGSSNSIIPGTLNFDSTPNTGKRITTSLSSGTVSSITNSLLGAAALTSSTTVTSGNNDDGYWTLTLPFNISFNGTTYTTIYVGTNSYITFGSGSSDFFLTSISLPDTPKIMISTKDNSCQRLYYGTEGSSPNRTYRVRFEGTNSTSGTLGSPNIVWEAVFYEATPSQIDIQIGNNARFQQASLTPVTTFVGGSNWKQISSSLNNNYIDFNTAFNLSAIKYIEEPVL